jgi:tRNA 2-selenouridine synthase SelU
MSRSDDDEEAETRAELIEWWDKRPTCLSCGRTQGKAHLDWCLRKKMQKEADK